MRLTELCVASLLLLTCQAAFAQDEALINDLSQAFQGAGAAQAKQKSKQIPAENLPPVTQPNTDLIDDVSPEQKRAAAEGAGMRGMRASGGMMMGMMMGARKVENAIPDNLGEALARALHHSPAILVAEAKVRQAQAELNEVMQTVVHDLTLAFKRRARNTDLLPQGSEEVREAVLEDETKILYLLGAVGEPRAGFDLNNPSAGLPAIAGETSTAEEPRKPGNAAAEKPSQESGQAMAGMMSAMRMAAAPGEVAGLSRLDKLPENVRSFLNKRVDLDFSKQPVQDVLEYIKAASDGEVDFVLQNPEDWTADPSKDAASDNLLVTVSIKRVTVAAAMQALADLTGCAFVFRDYGILVIALHSTDGYPLESYRALGAPMIAPPQLPQLPMGMGGMAMPPGMGGPMGGMMGLTPQHADSPANPSAEQ